MLINWIDCNHKLVKTIKYQATTNRNKPDNSFKKWKVGACIDKPLTAITCDNTQDAQLHIQLSNICLNCVSINSGTDTKGQVKVSSHALPVSNALELIQHLHKRQGGHSFGCENSRTYPGISRTLVNFLQNLFHLTHNITVQYQMCYNH